MKKIIIPLLIIFLVLFLTLVGTFLYGIFVLPQQNKNVVCIQSIAHACFLGTPVCYDFPNPCFTPPLWKATY